MSKKILIDLQKIQDPFAGLGQFCAHLKTYFDQSQLPLQYWIPNKWQKLAKKIPFILPRCDVFHATHQDSPYIPSRKKTKVILTIHDLNALLEHNDPFFHDRYKKMLQAKINRANVVTFISQFTKNEVEKVFDLNGKETIVIYNGISIGQENQVPAIAPKGKFLFSIGTILPKKNFHVLIDFLKELPEEYSIILAGTTYHSYAKEMLSKITAQGLASRFILVGTISEGEKKWYYQNATAFIFPSLFEGFGLPVAEAMSLGLPLFISNQTSLPEIGGDDAFYFENFEPTHMRNVFLKGINEFSEDKKSRLIQRAQMFDWGKAAKSYLEIYNRL